MKKNISVGNDFFIMNYLAHIYLSYENDQIKIGNFIADFIQGNKCSIYPTKFKKELYYI